MDRPISRRDFLDGVAIAIGATPLSRLGNQPALVADYPPSRTGLRGSHPGSFEIFHSLRDGRYWSTAPNASDSGERYDVVIVGAGISGLAAAHYYRRAVPRARILILDNHDDFGGHAKRNEFSHEGRTYLGYGGTQSIESPGEYSPTAKALLRELGIKVENYRLHLDRALHRRHRLMPATFFDRETFGTDALVREGPEGALAGWADRAPLSAAAKRDLLRLDREPFDPFPGESSQAKRLRLARMSYRDFLTKVWQVDPAVGQVFQASTHSLFGAGIDAVSAQDAFGLGLPGFKGLGLAAAPGPGQNHDAVRSRAAEQFYFHFPDGNATIARLLVRRLIPAAVPGASVDDVVTARVDYAALDRPESGVRIRLSSPVVRVRHLGDPTTAPEVEVSYAQPNRLATVRARAVVLACWHAPIPYLCPELPAEQKKALSFAVKVPLVYTNVLVRNWRPFVKLGVSRIECPAGFYSAIELDAPVSIGRYRHPRDPDQPIVLHLSRAGCKPGLPIREQHRVGRIELFSTAFETLERRTRDQLARVLGPGGFDPAADILAMTVNRWPHGYAYQYNSLWDDFWLRGEAGPCELARRPFGRIAIANSDAGAYSYTDAAIDHAFRAVEELGRLT
ncbi:MAG: FAD-dependent oxidoreductase [Gemmatimonadetes bacterium]|nr:FAD-dependent oxidoreductase [Gemmatimonadota bacterium]